MHGKFRGGIHVYGLNEQGRGSATRSTSTTAMPCSAPDLIREELKTAKQKIIAGQIAVTDAMAKS